MPRSRTCLCLHVALATTTLLVQSALAEEPLKPVDQAELNSEIHSKGDMAAFERAFEAGDELSEHRFDAQHGVGANIGEGRRFTRFPRADLKGPKEWAKHFPVREGGANATSCIACHNTPVANGAGDIAQNVVVDPGHTGDPTKYLERNTLPIVALGPVQRVAEEMSLDLYLQRMMVKEKACVQGLARLQLTAKGVSFGYISAMRVREEPCTVTFNWNELEGIDQDLVVRAFGWKGNKATIREFTRGAAHNELGLQAVELVGNKDGDFDGVVNELTVGDMTALTIYMAALERPVSKLELNDLGLLKVSSAERQEISSGREIFQATGCASCHKPLTRLNNPVFEEPSKTPGFYDVKFPDGSDPADHNLMQEMAVRFDMTKDQPNNRIPKKGGGEILLGATLVGPKDAAVINWYSDFKRHDMGRGLADPSDPLSIGAQMWLTRSLAGTGSTGPWLHDGRATTLNEAILEHGGEAQDSRNTYADLPQKDRSALVTFLRNLVIYKHENEGDEEH